MTTDPHADDGPGVPLERERSAHAPVFSRRSLLAGSAAAAGLVALAAGSPSRAAGATTTAVAFHGRHQAGIATPAQDRLVFAAFDVVQPGAAGLRSLLATWTAAADRLVAGEPLGPDLGEWQPPVDTGEAAGLGPASLTLTVGFGASLFDDRFGLRSRRPAALAALPSFPGDELDPARSGGDLCVQACADDVQVAFHAIRNLARLGLGSVALRWLQVGFSRTSSTTTAQQTPRNLLGFKDGTDNLLDDDLGSFDRFVWVGDEADQPWLRDGSYLVARRIRTRLEAWAATPLATQEATIGRFKASGAPLSGHREHDKVDLAARGARGVPVIPVGAHVRVAAPSSNGGARILRRGYSFADGVDPRTAELDAGLFFICFQKDPRRQFARIQSSLSIDDTLRDYVVHTSSSVFACPAGVGPGGYLGESLFRDA
jgi:deferrochelatase/peroxidase EfeB